jgi:hypothetical protein
MTHFNAPHRSAIARSARRSARCAAHRAQPLRAPRGSRRLWQAVSVAALLVSCDAAMEAEIGAGGRARPEPFPNCGADRICTYTIHLQRDYRPEIHAALVRRFDYVIVNKNSLDVGMAEAAGHGVPVVLHEAMQIRANWCQPPCAYEDWATIDAHEDWFLHDAEGNRVQVGHAPMWYMDYKNEEYLEYLAERFKRLSATHRDVDGVFLDENGFYEGFVRYALPRMSPGPIEPFPTQAEYDAANVCALEYLKEQLGTQHVVINSNNYAGFNAAVDGSMNEGFVHDNGRADDAFRSEEEWIRDLETLADPSNADRFVFVYPKCRGDVGAQRLRRYALATYLLGRRADSHAFFCFSARGDTLPPYHVEYDTPVGLPLGPHRRDDATGLWLREFENGIAVVHADRRDGPRTLALDGALAGEYVDWDGAPHSGDVTMAPNTGQFLLRAAARRDQR